MKMYLLQHPAIKIFLYCASMSYSFVLATTTFIPRSQGDNTARELVGWQQQLFNVYDDNYAAIASSIEYTRTLKTECLARNFFGAPSLTFAGSQSRVEINENFERTNKEIVADYFGLATDFSGTLAIDPKIENIIVDFNLYAGLSSWLSGLFLRINTPLTHTRWTLGLDTCYSCENSTRGCITYPQGYMSTPSEKQEPPIISANACTVTPGGTTLENCPANTTLQLPQTIKNNCTAPSLREALSGKYIFGDMVDHWQAGKFSFCPRSKTGLADIDISLGLNGLQNEWIHVGIFGTCVIPTGNRPKAQYVFEPIVGNGKHWQAGGGFTGHLSVLPLHHDGSFNTGLYFDARIMHVFKTEQMRSFDFLNNGQLSRYLLLKEFNLDGQYTGHMINAINFTTRNCEVSVGMQVDISTKFFIRYKGWEFDVGYNFFQREKETLCLKNDCPCDLDSRNFGIKGVEGVSYTQYTIDGTSNVVASSKLFFGLNTLQNSATMTSVMLPSNNPTRQIASDGKRTTALSWNSESVENDIPFSELTTADNFFAADISSTPVRISCLDLDLTSAAQCRMRTNKIFGHIRYMYTDGSYCPHIGIGAEGEFNGNSSQTLEQWGIWIKAGISF